MRGLRIVVGVILSMVSLPAAVFAQAAIAGTVRDTTGSVLPGVTVEATSPVLIEKVRTVVTDGTGQFQIIDLRPGTYTVTFTLSGFSTVRREGVQVTGTATTSVDADLRVGALEETITVTGEVPVVDIQNTTQQRSLSSEVISAIPTGRSYFDLAVLVPGVATQGNAGGVSMDVGGSRGPNPAGLTIHGSQEGSQRILYNGISLSTPSGSANRQIASINTSAYEEVTIDTGGASAYLAQGGVRINLIPRDGGNTFRATSFVTFASESMQGDNYTDELRDRGLRSPNKIKSVWDFNPGVGGPIMRDRLWWFLTLRHQRADSYVAGMFHNRNAGNPTSWTYEPDPSRPAVSHTDWQDGQVRVTWQASPKNKVAGHFNYQQRVANNPSATTAPKASGGGKNASIPTWIATAEWTSPVTNRLLLQGIFLYHMQRTGLTVPEWNPALIPVTEQGGLIPGLTYRGGNTWNHSFLDVAYFRFDVSYVTGAHAFRAGFNDGFGWANFMTYSVQPLRYRFNNGVPNLLTLSSAGPRPPGEWGFGKAPEGVGSLNTLDHDGGLYAQDRWTVGRLTLSGGIRWDFFSNHFPAMHLGPAPLAPTRNINFPRTDGLNWKDITPKFNAVVDLFGNGRTAVKTSLNKYMNGLGLGTYTTALNPQNGIVTDTTRSWNDRAGLGINNDYIPQCDMLNPEANGECGPIANRNFGTPIVGQRYDPSFVEGWNKRGYDWEFSAGVQHQLLSRVGVDVSYFRRAFGNFIVQDNVALAPEDFTRFSIAVPTDPRLPGGGGYTVDLYDVNPAKFSTPADWVVTLADNYGKQIERWHGVDVTINARLPNDVLLQGGLSTGNTVKDRCEITAKIPEFLSLGAPGFTDQKNAFVSAPWTPSQYCRTETPFLTQVKLLGSYTVPKVGVRVSATLQSLPGPEIIANWVLSSNQAATALGRPLAGNTPNMTVNIVAPGSLYGDRINQLDVRFGKVLNFAGTRNTVSVDLFNALNASAVTNENINYAAFRRPNEILPARFAKVSWQFDF